MSYHKSLGRVHWLIWNLEKEFKEKYQLSYDYRSHRYTFYRMNGKRLYDCFIVVRTSKRCFRVMYSNVRTGDIQYFSCYKSSHTARRMWYLYKIDEIDRQRSPP